MKNKIFEEKLKRNGSGYIDMTAYKAIKHVDKELKEKSLVNECVYCGSVIPEGRQICPICEKNL